MTATTTAVGHGGIVTRGRRTARSRFIARACLPGRDRQGLPQGRTSAVLSGPGAEAWLPYGRVIVEAPARRGLYLPLWTGLGLTYYLRDRIGAARRRKLHRFTAAFWVLAIVHTIGAGSDSAELWFLLASGLFVVPAAALLGLRYLDRWWNAPVGARVPDRA